MEDLGKGRPGYVVGTISGRPHTHIIYCGWFTACGQTFSSAGADEATPPPVSCPACRNILCNLRSKQLPGDPPLPG